MIQIYTGEGKGKTTAAIGQAIRSAGNGMKVLFVQFLKDGTSGEIQVLEKVPNITVDYASHSYGFYKNMTPQEIQNARESYSRLLSSAIEMATGLLENRLDISCEVKVLLILDEIMAAYEYALINREEFIQFLEKLPDQMEVILTGRNPDKRLLELSDYVTEMNKIKHPFDQGIGARKGIEY